MQTAVGEREKGTSQSRTAQVVPADRQGGRNRHTDTMEVAGHVMEKDPLTRGLRRPGKRRDTEDSRLPLCAPALTRQTHRYRMGLSQPTQRAAKGRLGLAGQSGVPTGCTSSIKPVAQLSIENFCRQKSQERDEKREKNGIDLWHQRSKSQQGSTTELPVAERWFTTR